MILQESLESRYQLKNQVPLSTTGSKEANWYPHLTMNSSQIPVESKVKVLVIFDSMHNFPEI